MSTFLMNFVVEKNNKKIRVEREFAAPLARVWAAWTEKEILDRWWAPKPWKAETKVMDFKVGGHWLYAMVGPDGTEHWCRADYKSIIPLKSYTGLDAFCDNNGNINQEFPRSEWTNEFKENGKSTIVYVEIKYQNLADLEKIIEMGMKEGFTAALENLDEIFSKSM